MSKHLSKTKQTRLRVWYKIIVTTLLFIPVLILYQGLLFSALANAIIVFVTSVASFLLLKKVYKKFSKPIQTGFLTSLAVIALLYISAHIAPINSEGLRLIFKPLAVSFFAYGLAKATEVPLLFKLDKAHNHGLVVLIGFLYGILFLLLNEPIASTLLSNFFILIVYTIVIAFGEELLFRGIYLHLFSKLTKISKAVHWQALLFSIVHMLSFTTLINYYKLYPTFFGINVVLSLVLYFVALYMFSLTASRFMLRNKNNLILPMQFHWLVNLFNITLVILL